MDSNGKNEQDDLLNSLLKNEYIDLSKVDMNDMTQLNTDDILRESQRLVNDAVRNKTIKEYEPDSESK